MSRIQKVDLSGYSYGKHECLNEDCGSSDAMQFYSEEDGAYCFSCQTTFLHNEDSTEIVKKEKKVSNKELKIISKEESARIKSEYTTKGNGYRGVRDEIYEKFAFRHKYDEDGKLIEQLVPVTYNSEIAGYKRRKMPKDFSSPIGETGSECELVNQYFFRNHTGTLVIVGGEIKALAAYQMFFDDNKSKGGKWGEIAVVSPTIGETGAYKQAKKNYNFINQFKKIVVCMDNDEAGEEAAEKLAKVLPRNKLFIMKMRYKDADTYITKGKQNEFIQDYWNAKPWSPVGIYTADQLYEAALAHVSMKRLPMPSFLPKLNNMLGGGIPKGGCIVLIAAASSIGKTTLLNQALIEWCMNDDEKFGVVSLEASAGDYATNLISYYTKTRYMGIVDRDKRVELMSSEDTKAAARELFVKEDGSPRFILCDDRGEKLEVMQEKIEEMVKACGCTAILIDVTSDLLSGLTIAEQELHMDWQKKLTKETGVTLINVVHIRKAASGQKEGSRGAAVSDESIMGSSTLYKSAAIIIGLERDKMAEDDIVRNTTTVKLLKNRANADTGLAGALYYDKETHRLYDFDEWASQNISGF